LSTGSRFTRRSFNASALATFSALRTRPAAARTREDRVAEHLAEMLMLGFSGWTTWSRSAAILADHIDAGRVRGIVLVKENVGTEKELSELIQSFRSARSRPLIAIDHEGGAVQRLTDRHHCTPLPSARIVAQTLSPAQAQDLYAKAGAEIAALGFNLNLGPVVDLHDAANPAIGHHNRAFDADPAKVSDYARAFIDGFAQARVHCALKHFPGHGRSREDSHGGLPDITATWSETELEPYAALIANGRAQIVMGGHLRLATIEKDAVPTTLSPAVTTGLLRNKLGFRGVIVTDDLDMTPVKAIGDRRAAVIKAIAAGNDILMIRNAFFPDFDLPNAIVRWVCDAIDRGLLREDSLAESAERVRNLKRLFAA
jgi:beta-N-acetylhexosaminidase